MKRTPLKRKTPLKRSSRRILVKIDPEDVKWSRDILDRDPLCRLCKHPWPRAFHAHHIIPRRFRLTRHDCMNGIGLCRECHAWAHDREREFRRWFAGVFPSRWETLKTLAAHVGYRLEKETST